MMCEYHDAQHLPPRIPFFLLLVGQIDFISRTQQKSSHKAISQKWSKKKNGYKLELVNNHQRGPTLFKNKEAA
jgi:hypothetical protein